MAEHSRGEPITAFFRPHKLRWLIARGRYALKDQLRLWPYCGLVVPSVVALYFQFWAQAPLHFISPQMLLLGVTAWLVIELFGLRKHTLTFSAAAVLAGLFVPYILYQGLQPALVIQSFHVPGASTGSPQQFNGDTVASVISSDLNVIQGEATEDPARPPCPGDPDAPNLGDPISTKSRGGAGSDAGGPNAPNSVDFIPTRSWGGPGSDASVPTSSEASSPATVEVKGISLEALIALAHKLLRTQRTISGDVIIAPGNAFSLLAQSDDGGSWRIGSNAATEAGLEKAGCDLAQALLRNLSPVALAAAYLRAGQYEDVLQVYAKPEASPRSQAGLLDSKGIALTKLGDGTLAVKVLKEAAGLAPQISEIHYNLGIAFMHLRDYTRAINAFRDAIHWQPDFLWARTNLANALAARASEEAEEVEMEAAAEDLADAILEFGNTMAFKPSFDPPHYYLGDLLGKYSTNFKVAEYRSRAEVAPDDAAAHGNLAVVLVEDGHLADAFAEYRDALELESGLAAPILARFCSALSKRKGTEGELPPEPRQDDTSAAEYHTERGVVLECQGKYAEAIAEFDEGRKLDPNLAAAKAGLSLAEQNLQAPHSNDGIARSEGRQHTVDNHQSSAANGPLIHTAAPP
jgi:tetratricopeptide (TPR) repeat protein